MEFIDFVLNLAALLLWLNWRSERLDAAFRVPVISLANVVRKAGSSPIQKWKSLGMLGGLLLLRAGFYWITSGNQPHSFTLGLTPISLVFRTNHGWIHFAGMKSLLFMVLYSGLSFLFLLAFFHLALLLCSLVNHRTAEKDAVHRFVCLHLGWLDRLPVVCKWLVPGVGGLAFWLLAAYPLAALEVVPRPRSLAEFWQQGAVIGVGVYVQWQWVILAVLLVQVITSYVYLGRMPIWEYLQGTGRNLVAPLQLLPLRAGKVDLTPIIAMALVSALAMLLASGWNVGGTWWLPRSLREGMPELVRVGVLPWLYQRLPF